MGETYADRAEAAEELARQARNERERRAFEEIARIWRRLAGGAPVEMPEDRTFGPS